MPKYSVFIFIVVIIQLLSVNGEEQTKKEEVAFCLNDTVLCVKDVLSDIFKSAKVIREMANEIERNIWKKEIHRHRLQENINQKRILLYSDFPESKKHDQCFEMNNIDKNDFVQLLIEEHDAVSYLYVSIKNLLAESFFDHEFDELFNKILYNLQHNMLCNYRNILYVYSEKRLLGHPKNGIQLLETRKPEITSTDYRSYAIIISKLSREWMERIEGIVNINKLANRLI